MSGYAHQAVDGAFNIKPVDSYDPSTGLGEAGVAGKPNLQPTGQGTQHGAVDGQFNIENVDSYNPTTGKNVASVGAQPGNSANQPLQYGGEIADQAS